MQRLSDIYRPITASPFTGDETYREIPPCDALKPYIRCFWGTELPVTASDIPDDDISLVIPDTCIDIIFEIDYTNNRYNGFVCTLDEHSYSASAVELPAAPKPLAATFAIRFYAWSAVLFAEHDFRGCRNTAFHVDEFFSGFRRELEPLLFDVPSLSEKARIAERFLLGRLHPERLHSDMLNALYFMLSNGGRAKVSDICGYASVSERRLERLFSSAVGASPKLFSSLVRYQLLWQDMLFDPRFNILDAVEKHGYFDQSHLLHDFYSRHLMSPRQAMEFAHRKR